MKEKILLYNPRPNPHLRPVDLPLSLLCISRFLDKEGYNIKIVSENLYDDHFDVMREAAKESMILGVSSMTGYQIYDGLRASRIAKEANKDIKVVWGGWHPSLYPQQVLENSYIDIVVKGQGERAFYDVVKRTEKGAPYENILGVHWKDNGTIYSNQDRILEPLNEMPPIPYHLVDTEKCLIETEFGNRTINYVSSYGCPFRCGFCCEQTVNKRRWVGLDAKKVVDDLERLEKVYKVNGVSMYDSNFFVDMKRAKGILSGMLERGLTIRLGNIDGRTKQLADADKEIWELLRATRCYSILTGAESGDQEALEVIKKDIKVEDNIRFAKRCHEYGIKVVFSTLVGLPILGKNYDELAKKTGEQIDATIRMFDNLLSYDSRHRGLMFVYAPYPGTPMYQSAVKLGFKEPKTLEEWSNYSLYDKHIPWVTDNQVFLVSMISSYIFMFLDSDTITWIGERIKSRIKRGLFLTAFKFYTLLARLRWKYKYFGMSIDYSLFQFAKRRNKSI
ncbi:MAG: radical SAM protein [Nitrospirota bacterium]